MYAVYDVCNCVLLSSSRFTNAFDYLGRNPKENVGCIMRRQVTYACKVEPQPEGGYVATFRDVPEAITQGELLIEVLENAKYVLAEALEDYVVFPERSPREFTEFWVTAAMPSETNKQRLEILLLLSGLESWAFSLKQPLPEHLSQKLNELVKALSDDLLAGD